ncbi:MAG: hypothetical protein K6V36_16535, partial [Anaerolineae bacterium]|nr:hypothetical protein [Anaerolineae bacterium]
ALQRPHCVILKAPSPVVTLGQRSDVALSVVNREPLPGAAQVQFVVSRPGQAAQEWHSLEAPSGAGIYDLGTVPVQTTDTAGEWRVVARLVCGGEVLAESTEALLALPLVDLTPAPCLGEPPDGFPQATDASAEDLVLVPTPRTLGASDWAGLLDGVAEGRTAVIGALHKRDELALRTLNDSGIPVRLHYGIGNWMGCYHWVPASGLFAGLPAGGLAGEAYVDVLPWYVMSELGGRVLAGCLRNTMTRFEPPAILWYSDIEVLPYGRGTLVFCQYRIFDKAHVHPVARALAANLILLARERRLYTT